MKVLIVDDSLMVRNMVKSMLLKHGLEPHLAKDGLEAVKILEEGTTFDVVLLDWNMPNLDGPGVLDAVTEKSLSAGKIVMMTTENSPERIQIALDKGASEYIMKPFTEDILLSKIEFVNLMSA